MIGHVIYTYNKITDAYINQEISKNLYSKSKVLGGTYLVHSFNGEPKLGYKKYLEDKLIKMKNPGHFLGAANMIDAGIEAVSKKSQSLGIRYCLVTTADTWMINVKFLERLIKKMKKEKKYVATCAWFAKFPEKPHTLATDFFVIDIEWNKKSRVFPLNYKEFVEKFKDYFYLRWGIPLIEVAFMYNYFNWFGEVHNHDGNLIWQDAEKHLLRITEREPVHGEREWKKGRGRKEVWPKIGLYTWNDLKKKKELLKKKKLILGKYSKELIGE